MCNMMEKTYTATDLDDMIFGDTRLTPSQR